MTTQPHTLPLDWKPTKEQRDWAAVTRPDMNPTVLNHCIEDFYDYWTGGTAKNPKKIDWNRTFKTWVRRARIGDYLPREYPTPQGRQYHGGGQPGTGQVVL